MLAPEVLEPAKIVSTSVSLRSRRRFKAVLFLVLTISLLVVYSLRASVHSRLWEFVYARYGWLGNSVWDGKSIQFAKPWAR